jgi:hypothetical protein
MGGFLTMVAAATQGCTTSKTASVTATFACSFASNQTFTNSSQIGEFALFNSSAVAAGATMFNHITTNPYINFSTSNTLAITITITN